MNALLWKDLYSTRGTLAIMLVIAILFSWCLGNGGPMSFFIGSAMASTVVGTCMNLDEKAGWHRFAISSGIRRRDILNSKCIMAVLAPSIGIIAGFIALGLGALDGPLVIDVLGCACVIVFGLCFGIFTSMAMIYCCYRLSSNYAGLFAAIIIGASVGLLVGLNEALGQVIADGAWVFVAISAILLALAVAFYLLAYRVLLRKDF
ncbi:MAG: ABC-2 transporter permease [archaeon]|nr:ABC-2 transporter permease [archaeon]